MTHVALVQGNCSPPQSTTNVTANLSATTYASIPQITGPLSCAAPIITIADGDIAPFNSPDGIVNVADILIMTQVVMGAITADAITLAHGDIYPVDAPDGAITVSDLLILYQLVLYN